MEQLNEILNLFQSYMGQLAAIELIFKFSLDPSSIEQYPAKELVEIFKRNMLRNRFTIEDFIKNEAAIQIEIQKLHTLKTQTDFIKVDDQWKYNFQNYLGAQKVEEIPQMQLHLRERLQIHLFDIFDYKWGGEDGYTNYKFTNEDGAFTFISEWFVNDIEFKRAILKVGINNSFLPYTMLKSKVSDTVSVPENLISEHDEENKLNLEEIFKDTNNSFDVCKELMDDLELTINQKPNRHNKKGRVGKLIALIDAIKTTPGMLKLDKPTGEQLLQYFNSYLGTEYRTYSSKKSVDYKLTLPECIAYIKFNFKK